MEISNNKSTFTFSFLSPSPSLFRTGEGLFRIGEKQIYPLSSLKKENNKK